MQHVLLEVGRIEGSVASFLEDNGEIFQRWDGSTHDSGNLSYGVRVDGERYFVKTAGPADAPPAPEGATSHADRIALLNNAATLAGSFRHPALPALRNVIESPEGPVLVYDFRDGELLREPAQTRDDPGCAYQRFRALPPDRILAALDTVYQVHQGLAAEGWVACDFYDGCLLYDFEAGELAICDLDHYHEGPFINTMGRMFGSTRFMAPEELERGAQIDQRTTVFTLGRAAAVLLSDLSLDREPFRGSDAEHAVMVRACEPRPEDRFPGVEAFHHAWQQARQA